MGDITADTIEIAMLIGDNYKQSYNNTIDNG
jgi:hypothetical protein